jgi:hypothetical protein
MPFPDLPQLNVTTIGAGAVVGRINGGYWVFRTSADASSFATAGAPHVASAASHSPDKLYDLAKKYRCESGPGVAF